MKVGVQNNAGSGGKRKVCFIFIFIHIKFKTRVKTVKIGLNSEKHTQVYGMYRAV